MLATNGDSWLQEKQDYFARRNLSSVYKRGGFVELVDDGFSELAALAALTGDPKL